MKKYIVALLLGLALFGAVAGVSTALADPPGTAVTCGQGDSSGNSDATPALLHHQNGPSVWSVEYQWACGSGKTFMWEIQRTNNGGASWNDIGINDSGSVVNHIRVTSVGGCSGQPFGLCVNDDSRGGDACSNAYSYRLKLWNYNDRTYTFLMSRDQANC